MQNWQELNTKTVHFHFTNQQAGSPDFREWGQEFWGLYPLEKKWYLNRKRKARPQFRAYAYLGDFASKKLIEKMDKFIKVIDTFESLKKSPRKNRGR